MIGDFQEWAEERDIDYELVDDEDGAIYVVNTNILTINFLIESEYLTLEEANNALENKYSNVGFYWSY